MRKFTEKMAQSSLELEQLVADYWHEVDIGGGAGAQEFFTEDMVADFGAIRFSGHDGVRKFYADRLDLIRREQKDGVRTTRHVYHNLRIVFDGEDSSSVEFLIATYGGGGAPPIANGTLPVAISDTRFDCRRCVDGVWRIYRFFGQPVFLGGEEFARKALVGS